MGQVVQAIILSKIDNNSFSIKTDEPNVEVSWQVMGVRHDPYAAAHPIQPEQEKLAICLAILSFSCDCLLLFEVNRNRGPNHINGQEG
jgi:hypothetical protein